jgi:hypothetical protein
MKRPAAVLAMLALAAALSAVPTESDSVTAAEGAATAWLARMDAAKYGDAWEHCADFFKKIVSKPEWEKSAGSARDPLGAVKSRKVRSSRYTKSLPGAPEGEYVVIQYDTVFEKRDAVETVTPMRDTDGVWRVSGYYIR